MDESVVATALLIFARVLYLGAGMVLVNATVFRWLVFARAIEGATPDFWRARLERQLRATFLVSAALLVIAAVLWFWAVSAAMGGTSLRDALDRETMSTVLFQTRFGAVCQVRIGLFALLAALGWKFCRSDSSSAHRASSIEATIGVVAAALLASVAWTGHAGAVSGAGFPWTLIADSIHLLAGTVWPAGLLFFSWILSSRLANENPAGPGVIVAISRRFSAVSLAAVSVLALTGLIDTVFLVRSFAAMVNTDYGRVLFLKLVVFAVMLVLAAWNRFRLLPTLGDVNDAEISDHRKVVAAQLRRFVRLELALAGGIVIIVAFLGTLPPPHH